jgi:hypothetical protein
MLNAEMAGSYHLQIRPSATCMDVYGCVGSLLEVGTGIHPGIQRCGRLSFALSVSGPAQIEYLIVKPRDIGL